MLNDLASYSNSGEALPAPLNTPSQEHNTVSAIDVSLLFQQSVQQAITDSIPVPLDVKVFESPDTPYLDTINDNLVVIRDHLTQQEPSSRDSADSAKDSILEELKALHADVNKLAKDNALREKRRLRDKDLDDKETRKYRDSQRRAAEPKSKSSSSLLRGSGLRAPDLNTLTAVLRNPYNLIGLIGPKLFSGLFGALKGLGSSSGGSSKTTTTTTTKSRTRSKTSSILNKFRSSKTSEALSLQEEPLALPSPEEQVEESPLLALPPPEGYIEESAPLLALPPPEEAQNQSRMSLFDTSPDNVEEAAFVVEEAAVSTSPIGDLQSSVFDDEDTSSPQQAAISDTPLGDTQNVVAGEGDEQDKFFKESNEANSLLTDTLSDPQDSEFVQAMTTTTTTTSGGGGGGMGLAGILTAAIAGILAFMAPEKFIDLLQDIVGFLRDVLGFVRQIYEDILRPILEPVIDVLRTLIKDLGGFVHATIGILTDFVLRTGPLMTDLLVTVLNALAPVMGDFVTALVTFGTTGLNVLTHLGEALIRLIDDPAKTLHDLGQGIALALGDMLTTFSTVLIEGLVHGFRMILPKALGGFDSDYKEKEAAAMEESYQKRVTASREIEDLRNQVKIQELQNKLESIEPSTSVEPVGVENESASSGTTSTTTTSTTNNTDIVVYPSTSDTARRPGGSL